MTVCFPSGGALICGLRPISRAQAAQQLHHRDQAAEACGLSPYVAAIVSPYDRKMQGASGRWAGRLGLPC